jgi:type I restriction enzyme S subunit
MSFPRYPAYKPSGVEWLGEVPEHWTLAPLKKLLDIQNGSDYKAVETKDGYPVIGSGGPFAFASQYHYEGESVLLGRKGTIDRPLYVRERFWAVDTMYWSKIRDGAHGRFAFYTSQCIPFQYYSTNTALPSMTKSLLGSHIVAVPCETEQGAIATFLDHETAKIDALIAEQQRLIELLQEKRQAVISHAVTKGLNPDAPMKDSGVEWLGEVPEHWDVKSCRNIASIGRGASPRPAGDSRYFGGDFIPWVTVAEITKDCSMWLCSTEQYLTEEGAANSTVFSSGTVIYSNSGATLGVPKILKIDCCANDGVVGFRGLDLSLKPEFLYHFLWQLTDSIREWAKQGQGQPNLNTEIIKSIKIPLPPLEEQVDILRKLDEDLFVFDSLVSEADKAQFLLGERRSALISAAVTGQIDVRGLVPEVEAA